VTKVAQQTFKYTIARIELAASRVVRGGDAAMKRAQMLIAVAVAVVVIVAAGLGAMLVLQDNKGGGADNSDYTTFWEPEVGRFVEYINIDESQFSHNWTMRVTVLSINATHMMRDEVFFDAYGDEYFGANWPAPINLTFGNGYDINYDMGWPVTVTEVGLENLSTPWGDRTCIRYHAHWSGEEDYFWVHNGVMLKITAPPGPNYQAGTWVLTSTNIDEVTHQS